MKKLMFWYSGIYPYAFAFCIILSILNKSSASDISQIEKNKLKKLVNSCFYKENDKYG